MGPHVLFSQTVPFMGKLQGGLTARKTIIVKGYVPPTGKRYGTEAEVGVLSFPSPSDPGVQF